MKPKAVSVVVIDKNRLRFIFESDGKLIGSDSSAFFEREGSDFFVHTRAACTCLLCTSDVEAAGFKKAPGKLYLPEHLNEQLRSVLFQKILDEYIK